MLRLNCFSHESWNEFRKFSERIRTLALKAVFTDLAHGHEMLFRNDYKILAQVSVCIVSDKRTIRNNPHLLYVLIVQVLELVVMSVEDYIQLG